MPGDVERQYTAFVAVSPVSGQATSDSGRSRLLSGAGNRYDYWRIAWHAWQEHSLVGVGAGNYAGPYFKQRVTMEDVRQPHSLPLQTLSELGVIGAVLLVGLSDRCGVGCMADGSRGARIGGNPLHRRGRHRDGERVDRAHKRRLDPSAPWGDRYGPCGSCASRPASRGGDTEAGDRAASAPARRGRCSRCSRPRPCRRQPQPAGHGRVLSRGGPSRPLRPIRLRLSSRRIVRCGWIPKRSRPISSKRRRLLASMSLMLRGRR